MIRLGYPTQNLTLPAGTNRTLRLANLFDKDKVRGLVRENIAGLIKILPWNAERNIRLFRMGQALVPFASHPDFPYDWEEEHGEELRRVGKLDRSLGRGRTLHPPPAPRPATP